MPRLCDARGWRRLSAVEWLLVGEAVLFLALARLVVAAVSFRHVAGWLCHMPETATCDESRVLAVRAAIARAAIRVPWDARCLPQALAAKAMLAHRGCGSSLHLGARFDAAAQMKAHAWLVAGGTIVVGRVGMQGITPVAHFGARST
ncbi:MAG TPA: lasso peptide biosynthesis B2 protein [Bryobacteraceae bacterium]|nr:lasso peptide biosynthesis B2 protein [Bryobacteraceae bacterium]